MGNILKNTNAVLRGVVAVLIAAFVLALVFGPAGISRAEDNPTTPSVGETWQYIGTDSMNVRDDHSIDGEDLGGIAPNTEIVITNVFTDDDDIWVQHTTDSLTGWSAFRYNGSTWFDFVSAAPAQQGNSDGVPQSELDAMVSSTTTVSQLLAKLDGEFNESWFALGGAWGSDEAAEGYTIPASAGGAWLWSDLGEGYSLPNTLTRVRTQGNWGIYELAPNTAFTVPTSNGGGRWVPIESLSGDTDDDDSNADLDAYLAAIPNTREAAVTYLDENPLASTRYFTKNEIVRVEENSTAIVWTDWGAVENIPCGAEAAKPNLTTGGAGVWLIEGFCEFTNTVNGGGITVFTSTSDADTDEDEDSELPSDLNAVLEALPDDIGDAIDYLNAHPTSGTSYFSANQSQTLTAGQVALVWTDFGDDIPDCAEAVDGLTEGGWGVWKVTGACTFANPNNGGGMTVFSEGGQG